MKLDFYTYVGLHKNNILVRGYKNGRRVAEKVPYKPYLFVPSKTETEYKTIEGKSVGRLDFDSIWDARKFIRDYKDVEGMTIYGMQNFVYTYIFDNFPGEIPYAAELINVVGLDIEVDARGKFASPETAENEVTLISLNNRGSTMTFGCKPFDVGELDNATYIHCVDERDLLLRFLDCWNGGKYAPDVLTGWNIDMYDVPYLYNRICRILGEEYANKLSPWGIIESKTFTNGFGKEQTTYNLVGIVSLDYLELYKKFAMTPQESYTLDHVCFMELGERKTDYAEYGSLAGLQEGNWQLYTTYNVRDTQLVYLLDEKLKLIDLVFAMAYDGKYNMADAFGTVRPWDVRIHHYLLEQNIVVPPTKHSTSNRSIIGGYVKEPFVGLHKWPVSFDVRSLYPSIMMGYNISPDTLIGRHPTHVTMQQLIAGDIDTGDLVDRNVTLTANGLNFTREKEGFIPAIQRMLFNDRNRYKKLMLEASDRVELARARGEVDKVAASDVVKYDKRQQAKKVELNSGFGAQGNLHFRWFHLDSAEAITTSGQLTTRFIEVKLNEKLNRMFKTDKDWVIAIDTDSAYLAMDLVVQHVFGDDQDDVQKIINYLDKVCKEVLEPYIQNCFEELSKQQNMMSNTIYMKRECIGNRAIWRGAKNYILNVYNNEGVAYAEPKLKMMGIEAIKTSTPQVCRDGIKQALSIIMNKTEKDLQQFMEEFRVKFNTMSFEQVAFPRSVSNLEQYYSPSTVYTKGTPMNSKASLLYNFHLKKHGLEEKYEAIASGQKIKYSYLKVPNPIGDKVIAAPNGKLPAEFGADAYIDYDTMYEKSFLGPVKSITNVIGWEVEQKATLESLFG